MTTIVRTSMGFAEDNFGYEITTEEQAKNWIVTQVEALRTVRSGCNIEFPGDKAKTAEFQRKAYRTFLVKHGGVLGMLVALHRCRKLSDVAYNELHEETMALLGPTIVGQGERYPDLRRAGTVRN